MRALSPIAQGHSHQQWADVGCSTGLITRLAQRLGYTVVGYDINGFSLWIARLLSLGRKHIRYESTDFHTLNHSYDVVSATSLLSVVEDKKESLDALVALLRDDTSMLVIIEPTDKLSVQNVWALIDGVKSFWYYKGLLLWASAREGKAIPKSLFAELAQVKVIHQHHLDGMVRVSYISTERGS